MAPAYICPGGEIGRRKGLKIPRWKHRAGSIPAPGTIFSKVTCFSKELILERGSSVIILINDEIHKTNFAIILSIHPYIQTNVLVDFLFICRDSRSL